MNKKSGKIKLIDKLEWHGTKDDITCRWKPYILRVEQMDTNMWWWAINHVGGERLRTGFAKSKAKGKKRCIDYLRNAGFFDDKELEIIDHTE